MSSHDIGYDHCYHWLADPFLSRVKSKIYINSNKNLRTTNTITNKQHITSKKSCLACQRVQTIGPTSAKRPSGVGAMIRSDFAPCSRTRVSWSPKNGTGFFASCSGTPVMILQHSQWRGKINIKSIIKKKGVLFYIYSNSESWKMLLLNLKW